MSRDTLPFSVNELRFYFTRAAVGVGAPFAIGEEFFESIIWLARHGIDPTGIAAAALAAIDTGSSGVSCELDGAAGGVQLAATDGRPLSALFAGPALADLMAVQFASGTPKDLTCVAVDQPALVVASLGARGVPAPISVSWTRADGRGCSLWLDQHGVAADANLAVEENGGSTGLRIRAGDKTKSDHPAIEPHDLRQGIRLSQPGWTIIYDYFRKCLVPSSQLSREQGAGAGLQDND